MAYKFKKTTYATVTGTTTTGTISVTANTTKVQLKIPQSRFEVDPLVAGASHSGSLTATCKVESLSQFTTTADYIGNVGTLSYRSVLIKPSILFNGTNPTVKSRKVRVLFDNAHITMFANGNKREANLDVLSNERHTFTVVLDAPPTFEHTGLVFDKDYIYSSLTTASVDLTNMEAEYGGYIKKATLQIGGQKDYIQSASSGTSIHSGTLSILLTKAGTFTPTITVEDSRGQTTVEELPTITVNEYNKPSAVMEIERATSRGVPDEEGEYGLATLEITYTDSIAKLQKPELKIDGGITDDVTWYLDEACTNAITNWSSVNPPSPATLYGVFGANLLPQQSYTVEVRPRDEFNYGTALTQMLPSSFYTIDFLAGGHGIAFGQPSVQDGFECNMDATFHQDLVAQDMTTQEVSDFVSSLNVGGGDEIINLFYPVGSYYETADGTFNPNVAWGGTWALESTAKQPTGESARISGRNTVNVTTTSSITVLTLQFTSETGRVYVHADCAFFTSRYTSAMYVIIDGVQIGYSTTNSTVLQRGVVEGIADVEIGAHTATVVLSSQDSGTTATLPPYNSYTLFVMDVANPNGGVYKWHRTA